MTRTRVGLLGVAAVLVAGLVVPSVLAQFPRGGPIGPNPGMRPQMPDAPGGPQFEKVWTCTGCGKEIGRGNFPPSTCPHCKATIINGIGNGDKPAQPDHGGFGRQPGQMQPNPGVVPGGPPGGYGGMNQQPVPVAPVEPEMVIPRPNPGGDFNPPGGWQPANNPQGGANPLPTPGWQTPPASNPPVKKAIDTSWVTGVVFALIAFAALVIIAAAVCWMVFLSNMLRSRTVRRAVNPRRRRRPRRYDDDEDEGRNWSRQ